MTEPSQSNANQCESLRRDGQPCQSPALPGRPFCYSHDPERTAEREEARRRGGRNRSNVARLQGLVPPRLMDVYDRLEEVLEEVHTGEITPQRATAVATVARAMVSVITSGEFEQRLREIEGRLGDGKPS